MSMHYALCNFDDRSHCPSTVPTRTRCIFRIMHYYNMHYYNFNCISLLPSLKSHILCVLLGRVRGECSRTRSTRLSCGFPMGSIPGLGCSVEREYLTFRPWTHRFVISRMGG